MSDSEKRKAYDQYGEDGLKNDGGAAAEDIFSMFFGRGNSRRQGPRKGEDVVHPLRVTLEDLYNGKTSKLAITRDRVCNKCDGSGATSRDAVQNCSSCNGRGVRVEVLQMGPGMIQQRQSPCSDCGASGKTVPDRHRCKPCSGKGVTKERKVLEVYVERGMKHGQKLVFRGEADESPGVEAGDVIFVLQQQDHDQFIRKGPDLVMEKTISLVEALTGFQFVVRHLDGRKLLVQSNPGEIIKPNSVKAIEREGMPIHKQSFGKGHLFIKFNVQFPESYSLTSEQLSLLADILPCPLNDLVPDDYEEVNLRDIDPSTHTQTSREAYEEDEESPGAQRVQCAQQ